MVPIWLGITIIAVIVEFLTVDLVSIWFVTGIIALIANLFGASQTIQIVLFAIVTIVAIIVTRPLAKKYLRANVEKTNFDRVIGKHGLVTKTITADNKGEVSVMSTSWLASSLDNSTLNEGDYCEIMAVEGAHLVVKKIDK